VILGIQVVTVTVESLRLPLPLPLVPFLPSLPLSWLLAAVLRATLGADLVAARFVVRAVVFFTAEVVEARFTGFFVPFGGLGLVVFLAAVLRTGALRVERLVVVVSDETVESVVVERERVVVVICSIPC
jgi:hypothetical protein